MFIISSSTFISNENLQDRISRDIASESCYEFPENGNYRMVISIFKKGPLNKSSEERILKKWFGN